MNPAERTTWIVEHARDLAFDLCGVAKVGDWPELAWLSEWLAQGYAGEMKYLHDTRRAAPSQVLPARAQRDRLRPQLQHVAPLFDRRRRGPAHKRCAARLDFALCLGR